MFSYTRRLVFYLRLTCVYVLELQIMKYATIREITSIIVINENRREPSILSYDSVYSLEFLSFDVLSDLLYSIRRCLDFDSNSKSYFNSSEMTMNNCGPENLMNLSAYLRPDHPMVLVTSSRFKHCSQHAFIYNVIIEYQSK